LEPDPSILALLLAGSIAHGFAGPDSDIDVAIVVEPDGDTHNDPDRQPLTGAGDGPNGSRR
jgi:predicted nucleotidyltransferase